MPWQHCCLQLFVRASCGNNLVLYANAWDKIISLKTQIEQKTHVPPALQCLIHGCELLNDHDALDQCNLRHHSMLDMFPRLRAGMQNANVRLTKVDPTNEPLRRIAEEVTLFYTKMLNDSVRQTFHLNSSSFTRPMPTLTLMCAHDCILDPFTDEKIAPHFVADCVDLCHSLADALAKHKFGDSELQLYMVLAKNAERELKRTSNSVKKAKKSVAKAENKIKAAVKKPGKSGAKAVAKATEARDKAKNALIKAESAAKQAEEKLKDATERAAESIKIQSAIIQCWIKALAELAKLVSHTTPDCVESCRIVPPGGSKINDQHQCTFRYVYIIHMFCSG